MGIFGRKTESGGSDKGYVGKAVEAGAARRERIKERFKKIGGAIGRGVNFILGAPEAASNAILKAHIAIRSGWENMGDSSKRLRDRIEAARDNLNDRLDNSRETMADRIRSLPGRAAGLGRKGMGFLVNPIIDRVNKIYSMPDKARIKAHLEGADQWQAYGELISNRLDDRKAQQAEETKAFIQKVKAMALEMHQRQVAELEQLTQTSQSALESAQAHRQNAQALEAKPPKFRRLGEQVGQLELAEAA